MLFLLFVPIIGFFVFKNIITDSIMAPDDFMSWTFTLIFGCIFTALISLAPLGLAAIIGSNSAKVVKPDTDYPLVTLKEKDGAVGNFFLGSGTINDQQYYFWYRNDRDFISGGKTVREPGVHIYEGNYKPTMRTFRSEYKSVWVAKYGFLVGFDLRSDSDYCPDFFIPTGSIQQGYAL